jgi:hypothetical protein
MTDMQPILDALSETGNLSKACRETGIDKAKFLRWCDADPENANRYVRARESGLDAEADRAIDEALRAEDAGLGRLALDARKWYLSKLLPKKYGDKQLVGSDPDNPLPQSFQVNLVKAPDASSD